MPHGNLVPLGAEVPLAEARLTAQKLQEAGIPCFLRGEAAALIAADATVLIEVDEEDFEHAQRVLAGPQPVTPDADEDGEGLATVEVFYDSLEAQHAADLLRARGIPCGLRGTTTGTPAWLAPEVVCLRLEVPACDLEKAFEILGFTVQEGEGEEEEADRQAGHVAEDHIRKAEPTPAQQLQRHPFQQGEQKDALTEGTVPTLADRETGPPELPAIEAGAGGVDVGLVVVLLLIVVGGALWLTLYLLS
jgi:hypothetical protein